MWAMLDVYDLVFLSPHPETESGASKVKIMIKTKIKARKSKKSVQLKVNGMKEVNRFQIGFT